MSEEKTFKPTQNKLEKARSEGKVLKSQLVSQAVLTVAGIVFVREILKNDFIANKIVLEYMLTSGFRAPQAAAQIALGYLFKVVIIVLGATAFLSVVAEVLQVGVQINFKVIAPQSKRLNPAQISGKLQASFGQFGQFLVRGCVVLLVFSWLFKDLLASVPTLLVSSVEGKLGFFSSSFSRFTVIAFIVLAAAAAVDYLVQRRRFNKEMMMSHTELRNELKDQEGDPLIRSLRKSTHEALLRQDMVNRVRRAKVVIVDHS